MYGKNIFSFFYRILKTPKICNSRLEYPLKVFVDFSLKFD